MFLKGGLVKFGRAAFKSCPAGCLSRGGEELAMFLKGGLVKFSGPAGCLSRGAC